MRGSLRPLALAPVLGLGLLACKGEPKPKPEPEQPVESIPSPGENRCDKQALAELAARLEAAEPDARVGLVATDLLEACPQSLPPTTRFALRDIQGLTDDERFPGDDSEYTRAKRLACPSLEEIGSKLEPLGDAPASQRAAVVYDLCDYGRYGLLSRDEFTALGAPGWLMWTTYALLLEQQIPEQTAKSIAGALFLLERAQWSPVLINPLPGQRFAKAPTANQLPSGVVVSASTTELVCMERPLAVLDAGALKPANVSGHVILPLFELLEEEAEKSRAVAESLTQPWDARLLLAFDERVPFATVVDSVYTAGRVGFTSFAFVVEPHFPVKRALHVSPPKYDELSASPRLKISIADAGFLVSLPTDDERREIPKRDPGGTTPDAWDLERLRELVEDFKQLHPEATEAVVSSENHTPLGVLLATFATLAGPRCDQIRRSDCLLPDLFIEAGAG